MVPFKAFQYSVCSGAPAAAAPESSAVLPSRGKGGQLQTSSPSTAMALETPKSTARAQHLIHHTAHRNTSLRSFLRQGQFIFTRIYAQSLFRASRGVLVKKFPEYIFVRLNTSASALTQ